MSHSDSMPKISLYYQDAGRDRKLIKILRDRAMRTDRSLSYYIREVLLDHVGALAREKS